MKLNSAYHACIHVYGCAFWMLCLFGFCLPCLDCEEDQGLACDCCDCSGCFEQGKWHSSSHPVLINALVFSSSMHDRLFLCFKVYAMLESLVVYSHHWTPLLGKCFAMPGYYQNCRRFCICLVVYKIYKTLKTNNLNAPLGGLAWNGGWMNCGPPPRNKEICRSSLF